MIDNIKAYIKRIDKRFQTGETTEHSFRGDLQQLLEEVTSYTVINEQKRIDCGAPDLALYKRRVPYAYIEAKDIEGGDLDGRKKNKVQFDRYKASLNTIVFTDYLDFHLYEEGSLKTKAELAYIDNGHIILNEEAVPRFISIIEHLKMLRPQEIFSSTKLSKIMASKARMLADAIEKVLANDTYQTGSFWSKLRAFKEVLNNDLDEKRFADLYAQTIAYGLFAARLHDTSPDGFSRQEAAELIPKTNPFLRQVFQQLAGYDINDSIAWIVDDLVNVFASVNVEKLRKNFGKEQQHRDPMIHFYEDFLKDYDPESKKKNGVFYTPQPVVEFIVRAVDDILKTDFNLPEGLADKSKVNVKIRKMEDGKDVETVTVEPRHRVQILDPATGTGTFLAEVVSRIKEKQQAGIWPKYVDEHLIPRIHGFELMMAPYTIAHLKLDMLISWWGDQKLEKEHDERVQIYLTNSLTQATLANKYLLAEMIAREANEANNIKHNAPVMIVMGNPPYSGVSQNNGEWITKLISEYRKEPNSQLPLQEKKNWLNDDYVKFIRLGQYYVDRNKEGILSYICSNGFIYNPTFRGMRWNLLNSFDKMYILNLHGRVKPEPEKCPDGSRDENVFDITVGTSINIFIKTGEKNNGELAKVYYADLYGLRDNKFDYLTANTLSSIEFREIVPKSPYYFLMATNDDGKDEYEKGFSIDKLFPKNTTGIVSMGDSFAFAASQNELEERLSEFINKEQNSVSLTEKYKLGKNYAEFIIDGKRKGLKLDSKKVCRIKYRPFDEFWTYFDNRILWRTREKIMKNMIKPNICLIAKKGFPNTNPPIFISDAISDFRYWSCSGMQGGDYVFPLYIYDENTTIDNSNRTPNFDDIIWRKIENWVKYGNEFPPLTANEQSGELGFDAAPEEPHFLTPEDIFDYIYGVLHSPHYREKYKEFLKVDFPRIPYPKNAEEFEHYKECGHQLRELHLMHNVPEGPVRFDNLGNGKVEYIRWQWNKDDSYSGNVWINDAQCFSNVPTKAWEMYIGGYQPAQKWLKDRKGRVLSTEDILHYEKIISVLMETKRIMDSMDDPSAQVEDLKKKVQTLELELKAQQSGKIINYGTINFNDNSTTIK